MKPIALVTTVKNEPYFLPKWLQYYRNYFDAQDIYILDDNTTDGSTTNIDANVIPAINPTPNKYNIVWIKALIDTHITRLVDEYQSILYLDADEFLVTRNQQNLRQYLLQQLDCRPNIDANTKRHTKWSPFIGDHRVCITTGYNIIHIPTLESKFNDNLNILQQRQYCYRITAYDKPSAANHFLNYAEGFHAASNEIAFSEFSRNDPNLIMLHAKLYDQDKLIQRYTHVFGKYDGTILDTDHTLIVENKIQQFIDHHFCRADKIMKINELFNYDYTHLF